MIAHGTVPHNSDPLPEGWAWTTLGEIAEINPRDPRLLDLSDNLLVTFIPMAAVSEETGRIEIYEERSLATVRKGYTPFINGDVIFAKITPSMENGKAAIALNLKNGLAFGSTEFHVLRPTSAVTSKWIFYFVRQLNFRNDAKANFTGTAGQLRVSAKFLENYRIPLAPLNEQHRIVIHLETLLTQLDAGISALKRLHSHLRSYRSTALKLTIEGQIVPQNADDESAEKLLKRVLTERRIKWEAQELARYETQGKEPPKGWRDRYVEPLSPDTTGLPELPLGWVWANLGQLTWDVGYGTSQKSETNFSGPAIIRIPNILKGIIDLTDLKYAPDSDDFDDREALSINDFLVIRTNGSKSLLGRAALVKNDFDQPHFYASYLIRFRLVNIDSVPQWISSIWDSSIIRDWIETNAATTAGQYNVNIANLSKTPVPLPPSGEQNRIIEELQKQISIVSAVDQYIDLNLRRAEHLRQSILKQAFEGKLVSQSTEDEPANILLERVWEEREERAQAEKEAPKIRREKPVTKRKVKKPLYETLVEAGEPLTPRQLFELAGFTADLIEVFYEELRREVRELERIEALHRRDGEYALEART